ARLRHRPRRAQGPAGRTAHAAARRARRRTGEPRVSQYGSYGEPGGQPAGYQPGQQPGYQPDHQAGYPSGYPAPTLTAHGPGARPPSGPAEVTVADLS